MDKERRKELREAYETRHTTKGIVAWKKGDKLWIAKTDDANADYNGTSFQLKLGSWPNKDLQNAYKENPDEFQWIILKELEYEDPTKDYSEDLEIMLMEAFDEYPNALLMKPNQKRRQK